MKTDQASAPLIGTILKALAVLAGVGAVILVAKAIGTPAGGVDASALRVASYVQGAGVAFCAIMLWWMGEVVDLLWRIAEGRRDARPERGHEKSGDEAHQRKLAAAKQKMGW